MPVIPTRARAAIKIFRELRIAHSAGWTPATVSGGWFSWTAMKMAPAATAARPADRVNVVGVMSRAVLSSWSYAVIWDVPVGHWGGQRRLLHLRPHHDAEADEHGDEQPGNAGDGDVGPLLAGEGVVEDEESGLGELDVDPGLQGVEPVLALGEQAGDGGQQERQDEVGDDGAGGGAEEHAEHEADEETQHHAEDVVRALCHGDVPDQ